MSEPCHPNTGLKSYVGGDTHIKSLVIVVQTQVSVQNSGPVLIWPKIIEKLQSFQFHVYLMYFQLKN